MAEAVHRTAWETALKLLNERFPILVYGDPPVRERVARARAVDLQRHEAPGTQGSEGEETAGPRRLEITTYRGRRISVDDVHELAIRVQERDAQDVPVAYELVATTGTGDEERLRLWA